MRNIKRRYCWKETLYERVNARTNISVGFLGEVFLLETRKFYSRSGRVECYASLGFAGTRERTTPWIVLSRISRVSRTDVVRCTWAPPLIPASFPTVYSPFLPWVQSSYESAGTSGAIWAHSSTTKPRAWRARCARIENYYLLHCEFCCLANNIARKLLKVLANLSRISIDSLSIPLLYACIRSTAGIENS